MSGKTVGHSEVQQQSPIPGKPPRCGTGTASGPERPGQRTSKPALRAAGRSRESARLPEKTFLSELHWNLLRIQNVSKHQRNVSVLSPNSCFRLNTF